MYQLDVPKPRPNACIRRAVGMALLLATAVLAPSPSSAVVEQTTEGDKLVLTADVFAFQDIVQGSLAVAVGPDFGVVTKGDPDDEFDYEPDQGFFGPDQIVLSAVSATTGEGIETTVDIVVLPAALPVAGQFDWQGKEGFGLYHQRERYFQFCLAWTDVDGVLDCESYVVKGAKVGWLPVHGDWDGTGSNLPSLFDPSRGKLFALEWAPNGEELALGASRRWPFLKWTWPVAGDWWGTGEDSLLLVETDGTIHEIQNPIDDPTVTVWGVQADTPAPRWPWPTAYPIETSFGTQVDAVGVVDFDAEELRWLGHDQGATVSGSHEIFRLVPHQVPIGATPEMTDLIPTFYFLEAAFGEGEVLYTIDYWTHAKPSTLPLRFPSDPPGG